MGYWNGFGGKVEPDERVVEAAERELLEEANVRVQRLARKGMLTFLFDDQSVPWEVHVFEGIGLKDAPSETEEMRPEWFRTEDIPYDKMWADDKHWYPLFLAGKRFEGEFHFKNTHTLVDYQIREVDVLRPES